MLPFAARRTLKHLLAAIKSLFHSSRSHDSTSQSEALPHESEEQYVSVVELQKRFGDTLPLQLIKVLARDILCNLRDYEKAGIIHGDINQYSIVMNARDLQWVMERFKDDEPGDEDVESSVSSADQFPVIFQLAVIDSPPQASLSARSPEAIIGAPRNVSGELWSLACVIYWLLTNEILFDPSFQCTDLGLTPDESHIIQIMEMFGEFPPEFLQQGGESRQWFNADGSLLIETTLYPVNFGEVLRMYISVSPIDADETFEFLGHILRVLPWDRTGLRELSRHVWLSTV